MPPRFFVQLSLSTGDTLGLPASAARHAQVLRLQPGDALTLFNGEGGEFAAEVLRMGRSDVDVRIDAFDAVERELPHRIVLAFGMPANDRMDWLVEKATELGAAALQPLVCERSVLRLAGERAEKKRLHWQAVAVAASEQSGRTKVPEIAEVLSLSDWLRALTRDSADAAGRWLLSTAEASRGEVPSLRDVDASHPSCFLSGPEGGFGFGEEDAARRYGFRPVSLGRRVLRADTAPVAVLAALSLGGGTRLAPG